MKDNNPFAKLGALDQKLYQDTTPKPQPVQNTGKPAKQPPPEKKSRLLANQQTGKQAKTHVPDTANQQKGNDKTSVHSPPPNRQHTLDTSLLTTKEKTKYGTYLTDESIEKIRIRAIQTKRDDHQILQEAVNQYLERLEK